MLVARGAPELLLSRVNIMDAEMRTNSSLLGCPLTWRRALHAQAAAASSTPRGTRILAEAGRFDTLGFSPAHQLQVDVLGSSGLLFTRDWHRPEEPDPGPGLACLGWCSPRRGRWAGGGGGRATPWLGACTRRTSVGASCPVQIMSCAACMRGREYCKRIHLENRPFTW